MNEIIYPTDEQVELAAETMMAADRMASGSFTILPDGYLNEARHLLVLLLNKDKILGEPASALTAPSYYERLQADFAAGIYPRPEPSPIALTEDHIPSLERAIRAEGYDIKVDTETGEVKLRREQK